MFHYECKGTAAYLFENICLTEFNEFIFKKNKRYLYFVSNTNDLC